MKIALYILAGWQVLGMLLVVGYIGKPRKPITPGAAIVNLLAGAASVTLLILAARQLS